MTDFTNIPNANLETGKPIRAVDGRALRDNPLAMFEGNGPKLLGEAVATATNGLPVLTIAAVGGHELTEGAGPVAGTTTTTSLAYVPAMSWTITCFTGSARLGFAHRRGTGSSGASQARVMLNGVSVATWSNSALTDVSRVLDIDIAPGDVLVLEHSAQSTASSSIISSISLSGSNAYRPVSAFRRVVT